MHDIPSTFLCCWIYSIILYLYLPRNTYTYKHLLKWRKKSYYFESIIIWVNGGCLILYRLSDYGLKDLPADILKHMKSIKTLDFSRNNLTTFPEVTLKTLETLDISENNIDSIDFVKNLPNLKQLMVEGNPNIQVKFTIFC